MQPITLFQIASQQANWLSVRHSVVAGNIANSDTTNYVAKDVEPFETVMEATSDKMATTHPQHISTSTARGQVREDHINGVNVFESGNTVSLPVELAKGSEVKRHYEINTGIVKTMNRLMLSTVKT